MVEHIVVDHISYECRKCGHSHFMDVTVPVVCPACEPATPYYLAEEWVHGAALVLYRHRKTDESAVRICIFTDHAATLSAELRERAEMVMELLTGCEMEGVQ